MVFGIFVALFILIFLLDVAWVIILIVRWVRRTRKIVALKRTGQRVIAQVTSISREFVFAPRGYGGFAFVWYVVAEWTDPRTGIPYQFKSEPLYRRQAKRYTRGELIGVLVDPADPNRYSVERAH